MINTRRPETGLSPNTSLEFESGSPKRAKCPQSAPLWRLSEDILQTELIPRLQAHQDGSVLAFAQTSFAAQTQTTLAVAKQLVGIVRSAFSIDAFAYDPVASAQGRDAVFEPGAAHPAAGAYAAWMRLEKFFASRGVAAQEHLSDEHRPSRSVEDALAVVEAAAFSCMKPHRTPQQFPHDTRACLRQIKAHMLHPIDQWVKASAARALAEPSYDIVASRSCLNAISQVAEQIKNRESNSIDFELHAFRAGVIGLPPIWLYDATMEHVQLVLAPGALVPNVLRHLPAVKTLKVLGHVDEAQLYAVVKRFDHIETLALGGLTMQSMPRSLTALRQLKRLSFEGAFLNDVDCLSEMHQLEYLVADHCPLLDFPIGVCSLINLDILGFYHCGITAVPEEIVQLQKLRMVEIFSDARVDLPDAFKHLASLQVLELNSSFTSLPLFAAQMSNLKILHWGRDTDDLTLAPDRLGHMVKGEEGYWAAEVTQEDVDEFYGEMLGGYVTL